MTAFTKKELLMLGAFAKACNETNSAATYQELKDDNMSAMNANDLGEELGWSKQSIGGVMQALAKKNAITDSGESARGSALNDWYLNDYNEDACEAAFIAMRDNAPAEPTPAIDYTLKGYIVSISPKKEYEKGVFPKYSYKLLAHSNNDAKKRARVLLRNDDPTLASGLDFGPIKYRAKRAA